MARSLMSVSVSLLVAALMITTHVEAALWFDRIYVVIFENTNYASAIADPNFAKWAAKGKKMTNYHGVAHPSQPITLP